MQDGLPQTIPIANLVNPQVSDLAFSRADFNGAVYQMLIGLLQTATPPKDMRQWKQKYYSPPSVDELNDRLRPLLAPLAYAQSLNKRLKHRVNRLNQCMHNAHFFYY